MGNIEIFDGTDGKFKACHKLNDLEQCKLASISMDITGKVWDLDDDRIDFYGTAYLDDDAKASIVISMNTNLVSENIQIKDTIICEMEIVEIDVNPDNNEYTVVGNYIK